VLIRATTQTIFKSHDVVQVNIPAESGEMGVLANHVPSIEQLKPGLVEVVEEGGSSKQFFRTCAPSPGIPSRGLRQSNF
jgi:F0F1-type ATP synthase epsilon subunit